MNRRDAPDPGARRQPASRDTYARQSRITPELVETIRASARAEAERTSLRVLASRIGVGHSTLNNFLRGAQPHPRVRRILYDWHSGRQDEAASAFDRLLDDLPEAVRARVCMNIARVLAHGYRESGVIVPEWLALLESGGSADFMIVPRTGRE